MLQVKDLRKEFVPPGNAGENKVVAIDGINFDVHDGEMFTLLGPSGCGKTTTLRCIAGLENPSVGTISIDGTPMFDDASGTEVPANRRQLGMVFQSYAIWPHLSVFENAAFPLRVLPRRERRAVEGRALSKKDITARVTSTLTAVGLEKLASRRATDLSGGQQQRLALARAMVMSPKMLLLDEPLSNLDAKLRERMRFELKNIQRSLGLASLYVTHDQAEALSMSDRIAIMRDGQIIQMGRPDEVYTAPNSEFVAAFLGNANTIEGVVETADSESCRIQTEFGRVECVPASGWHAGAGDRATISIRPESIVLSSDATTDAAKNTYVGTITGRAYLGDSTECLLTVGATELRAKLTTREQAQIAGEKVGVRLSPRDCLALPKG